MAQHITSESHSRLAAQKYRRFSGTGRLITSDRQSNLLLHNLYYKIHFNTIFSSLIIKHKWVALLVRVWKVSYLQTEVHRFWGGGYFTTLSVV
jgi:hypothetical protein